MFGAALKRSAIWRNEVPSLASPAGFNLRESKLAHHDLSIPVTINNSSEARTLHVILITSHDLNPDAQQSTLARMTRLSHQTGGVDLALVFNLQSIAAPESSSGLVYADSEGPSDSQHAYTALTLLVLRSPVLRGIPILCLPTTGSLVVTLKSYVAALSTSLASAALVPNARSQELLSHATASAPTQLLGQHAANVISSVLPDLRTLVGVALESEDSSTEKVKDALDGEVSREEWRGIVEFWEEEWVVE